jgi:hypothetical protein
MTALALVGMTACGDTAEPDGVTAGDLQQLEDEFASLEERVGVLEGGAESDSPDDGGNVLPGVGLDDLLADPQSFLGQEVTVTGEISELWTTADSGAVFRIAGDAGDPIAVVSPDFAGQLDGSDDVEVTGTVTAISSGTFEEDFGAEADALLADPEEFFAEVSGEPALAAEQVEVLAPSDA